MYRLLTHIDRAMAALGHGLAWLMPLMVLVTCVVVLLRYGFGSGSIALQESITYLHATAFLLGAGYTLQRDGHVRVDVLYRNFTPRRRAWINALGTLLFLLPLCGYIIITSWDFVAAAWRVREGSADGGLPAVFLLKSLIPACAVVLALQGLAQLLRSALELVGARTPPLPDERARG
jgi:TRAP-type mannitol/chloroaromatic compound transport system permease small subunit